MSLFGWVKGLEQCLANSKCYISAVNEEQLLLRLRHPQVVTRLGAETTTTTTHFLTGDG